MHLFSLEKNYYGYLNKHTSENNHSVKKFEDKMKKTERDRNWFVWSSWFDISSATEL